MLNFLVTMIPKFLLGFLGFWQRLPDKYKREIIDYIVSSFPDKFRQYYRNSRKQQDNK
jgi:hypothetical protein